LFGCSGFPAPTPDSVGEEDETVGLAGKKVVVFLNSVEDVDGVTGALRRAGLEAVPYHAKTSVSERSANLDRFRRFDAERDGGDKREEGGDEDDDDDGDDDGGMLAMRG